MPTPLILVNNGHTLPHKRVLSMHSAFCTNKLSHAAGHVHEMCTLKQTTFSQLKLIAKSTVLQIHLAKYVLAHENSNLNICCLETLELYVIINTPSTLFVHLPAHLTAV